jgi:geranylgeranyl diphosphate synthase type II
MHSIKELKLMVDQRLVELQLRDQPPDLYDPIRYMLSLGGKRMRPVLVLMGCQLFNGEPEEALSPAIGIEVFHNFTLLHDDIMDDAPLRRSQPTVFRKWNPNVAILSGDAMFVKACQLMMDCPAHNVQEVMRVFLDTSLLVCEGQQLDMDFEMQDKVSIDAYIDMIGKKTAVLLAGALKIGAIIAGADNSSAEHLYRFGKNIGIAFQLKDDLLDVFGDEEMTGKQTGGDIIANKKTFLLLKAFELASDEDRRLLHHWMEKDSPVTDEKVRVIKQIYRRTGVRELGEAEMEKYYLDAMKDLESINTNASQKEPLLEFASQLMVRTQ